MGLDFYKITEVEEPEFGCEGPMDGMPVNGVVHMISDDGTKRTEAMEFSRICQRKLFEGESVLCSDKYGLLRRVKVSAAIILSDGKLFAAQRGYGPQKGMWEFAGGKVEKGETPDQTVVREIREELGCQIEPQMLFDTVEFDYPEFHLTMYCYICRIVSGEIHKLEHQAFAWLSKEDLFCLEWLPADIEVLKRIAEELM